MFFRTLLLGKNKKTDSKQSPLNDVYEQQRNNQKNIDWEAALSEKRLEVNDCIKRLQTEHLLSVKLCQFADEYGGALCVVAYINKDIDWLVNQFWEYDCAGDFTSRDITGASIADAIFKKDYWPNYLQGEYGDIDWKDFLSRLLPNDFSDKSFLAGYGGQMTVFSLYDDTRRQGNFDSFYYVELLKDWYSFLPQKSEFDRTPNGLFLRRREFLDSVEHVIFDLGAKD